MLHEIWLHEIWLHEIWLHETDLVSEAPIGIADDVEPQTSRWTSRPRASRPSIFCISDAVGSCDAGAIAGGGVICSSSFCMNDSGGLVSRSEPLSSGSGDDCGRRVG